MVEGVLYTAAVTLEDLCEDGGQLFSTNFQCGKLDTIWAWFLPDHPPLKELTHNLLTNPEFR